ncbi:hypothetical protein FOPG_20077 [Fusarium oxysporum f. sp. conglutinans race 2 54008]|uniref:Uncharacterized protein n=1 Tax=Fusarium oxysporum f. sp. conglutinans race 2 54008 TaxID=1089457 RepID=X0GUP8_FUSOX|nr:hypothetical protein FOPG_20077 [Fusarium oxysporum f. sp. conglutinans race 2 54008]
MAMFMDFLELLYQLCLTISTERFNEGRPSSTLLVFLILYIPSLQFVIKDPEVLFRTILKYSLDRAPQTNFQENYS